MDTDTAIKTCQRWFDHVDLQKVKAEKMQQLAAQAKRGGIEATYAQRQLRQINNHVTVYDGARLREAVEQLVSTVTKMDGLYGVVSDLKQIDRLLTLIRKAATASGHIQITITDLEGLNSNVTTVLNTKDFRK